MSLKQEQKENRVLKTLEKFKHNPKRYVCKCAFCGREIVTQQKTANEGICYQCRLC